MAGLVIPHRGIAPCIADDAFVAPTAVIVGDVEIGPQASIWFGCVVRGDMNWIRVGARTNIQDGTIVHVTKERFPTTIGAEVSIGHLAIIHGCVLEDGCFVGMNAVIMDGAVVEGGAMVAGGALVSPGKRVKRGELWGGRPAKFMRAIGAEDADVMTRTVRRYIDLAREYREEGK